MMSEARIRADQRRARMGLIAGLLGCVFGVLGILTFGIVFVPLAALCSVIGLLRGVVGLNASGIGVSLLGGVLTMVGFIVSPSLWLLAGGLFVASQVHETATWQREPTASEHKLETDPATGAVMQGDPKQLRRAKTATIPCSDFLAAYGTNRFDPLGSAATEYLEEKDNSLGSYANMESYLLTECRLHENFKMWEAIRDLSGQSDSGTLPPIPVGGADTEPQVQADREAFAKWIQHQGQRPLLGAN